MPADQKSGHWRRVDQAWRRGHLMRPWRKSPFEQSHYLRPSQRIKMQIEADDRRRRFNLNVERVDLDREDSEQIAMRMVALRRTWAAIARCAEISACLQCARRQLASWTGNLGEQF
jgi:hypothetical protein